MSGIFMSNGDREIKPNPADKTFLLIEREALLKDAKRLSWLQEQLDKKSYTGKCVFRWSTTGRGWRLHETSDKEGHRFGFIPNSSVREAIDQAMERGDAGNRSRIEGNSEAENSGSSDSSSSV